MVLYGVRAVVVLIMVGALMSSAVGIRMGVLGYILLYIVIAIVVGLGIAKIIRHREELPSDICRCHHDLDKHTHYRDGEDCSMCECNDFHFYMTLDEYLDGLR